MADDGNFHWGHETSFTTLLASVQYEGGRSHSVGDPLVATTSHQGGNTDHNYDDMNVDEFGIEHEDDIDQSSEDEEAIEANVGSQRMSKEASTITPSWNATGEPDPVLMNSWKTWYGMDPFPNQDEFAVGQLFSSLQEMKRKIIKYSVSKGKEFTVKKARDRWYTIVCKEKQKGCPWGLSAHRVSEVDSMWKISTCRGVHAPSCVRDVMQTDNRSMTQKYIAEEIVSLIRVDKTLTPRTIIQIILDRYHVKISYKRAWAAKQQAIASIFGDWEESYTLLPRFMAALQRHNPGTIVEWGTIPSDDGNSRIFQRVFWSFGSSIQGFQHCRPLISIDGTHMYAKYKGCLLIAMAVDANQQIFPLAFAIVESENGSSWPWFMDIIGSKITQRAGLCVISDRHPGIMKAMRELPRWREPNAVHRFCVRHVVSNFNNLFKDKYLKNLVGSTAYVPELAEFERRFEAIGLKNSAARDYLEEAGKDKWSLSHDNGFRYGVMTTNMSECFNGVMKGARSLPITGLVKSTFYKLNSYFVERGGMASEQLKGGHLFSKKIEAKLQEHMLLASRCHVIPFSITRQEYEVQVPPVEAYDNRTSYVVNLIEKTCTCQIWKIWKVPCPHVLAVCRVRGFSHATFVDSFYTTAEYVSTYRTPFHPVGDTKDWCVIEGPPIIPDKTMLRHPGRPGRRKTTRYRNEMDIITLPGKNCCGLCGKEGHNRRSCASRSGGSGR